MWGAEFEQVIKKAFICQRSADLQKAAYRSWRCLLRSLHKSGQLSKKLPLMLEAIRYAIGTNPILEVRLAALDVWKEFVVTAMGESDVLDVKPKIFDAIVAPVVSDSMSVTEQHDNKKIACIQCIRQVK